MDGEIAAQSVVAFATNPGGLLVYGFMVSLILSYLMGRSTKH